MKRRCLIFLIIFCFTLNSNSKSAEYYYIVKPNDNASTLLYKANLKPIYHKLGTLEILQKTNQHRIADIDHLEVGDKLFFPEYLVLSAKNQGFIKVTRQNEIVFNDQTKSKLVKTRNMASDENQDQEHIDAQDFDKNKDAKIETSANNTSPINNKILEVPSTSNTELKLHSAVQNEVPKNTKIDPENTAAPVINKIAQSNLVFSLGSGYSRIDSSVNSTSANAVLLSKPLLSAHFKWEQNWSTLTQSFIRWSFESIPYQDSNHGSIDGEKQNVSLMGFGLNHELFAGILGSIELGGREEIFVTSYQTGSASLETRPITYCRLAFSKRLVSVKNLSLNGSLGGSYLSGASGSNYEAHAGQEYFGQLQLTQKLKNFSFFATGEYVSSSQKTSMTNQSRKDIKTELGFIFPLGEETP